MPQLPDMGGFQRRLEELDRQMAGPDFFSDARRAATLSREHAKLSRLLEQAEAHRVAEQQLADNRAILADATADADFKALAQEEIPQLEARINALYNEVLKLIVPPEPSDSRNTILEIRAGTGGDEAGLFAADLLRMYTRYAEDSGWKVELMSTSLSDAGGYREVSALITGEEVYRLMKFESGVHRVQRVPATEAQGRIHTSTATVAVLPEAEEVDLEIDPSELEVTVARASGPGGQGVNTTDSAVQILHKPTGMIVKCADERSQIKNRAKAFKVLRSRLLEQKERAEREKYAAHRKSQIGTGDRSERIRTYNFPQGRLTDHRIGLTLYSLQHVIDGRLQPVIDALQDADRADKLRNLFNIDIGGPVRGGTADDD